MSEQQVDRPDDTAAAAAEPEQSPWRRWRSGRRDRLAAALIGVLTLLLGFAFAVQVRSTDADGTYAGAREEDLVRILDEVNAREDRLRDQIAEQRAALEQLTNSDSQAATALSEAEQRATALGILNGTIPAQGPGITMTITDPAGEVSAAVLLNVVQELRGAGAETMQVDGVRIGVSSAVTGDPGALQIDGEDLQAPYEVVAIGSAQDLSVAMQIPTGVSSTVRGKGGDVRIEQSDLVVVDALRVLDDPQYADPDDGD
ncbi:DUF881 domain-containing protein [Modestobacter sp. Leaf380]|uniref:DUF881 domain-containing protein n=1 Tax=Modestobacter sp. Leaf380 TaxID=1736356 RepID=UPI0009E71FDC|nr:DUF881 domain-containing protein [Modestobacter sp. Leaf380]